MNDLIRLMESGVPAQLPLPSIVTSIFVAKPDVAELADALDSNPYSQWRGFNSSPEELDVRYEYFI